jgi:Protein of unknown function (DUF3079)
MMASIVATIPFNPAHPERICWGCDKFCAADDLRCGNGTVRTMHPCELFGPDWLEWSEGEEGLNPYSQQNDAMNHDEPGRTE